MIGLLAVLDTQMNGEKGLDDERIAKEAEKAKREVSVEESVDVSAHQPLHSSLHSSIVKPREIPQERCKLGTWKDHQLEGFHQRVG